MPEGSAAAWTRIMAIKKLYRMGYALVINIIMKTIHSVHKTTIKINLVREIIETPKAFYKLTTTGTIQVLEFQMQLLRI